MSKTPAGKKDLSSKLAGAVRAAKTEHVAQEEVVAPGDLPPMTPVHPRAAKPGKLQVAPPRARQSGQAQSSPDDPLRNLHPERIWPD
ncbi:MAG: hypothetical protein HY028_11020 [Gammaproteobacteria bacterium]|nr:hypothetical protein [Gammaproteobacteria bacterium]